MLAALWGMKQAPKGLKSSGFKWAIAAFVLSWLVFAVLLGFKDGQFRSDKMVLSIPGAVLIILGLVILYMQRKMNVFANPVNYNGPSSVFSPGMALFILGWILIVCSIAKMDEKTEVCE